MSSLTENSLAHEIGHKRRILSRTSQQRISSLSSFRMVAVPGNALRSDDSTSCIYRLVERYTFVNI